MIETKRMGVDSAKRGVYEYWNYGSRFYDHTPGIRHESEDLIWQEELAGVLGPKPLTVIDVGTGTGYIAMILGQLGHQVTGVDFSPNMLEIARERNAPYRSNVTILEGDAENLAFPNDAFDALTARYVLWTQPRPEEAIREWMRVIKPGGRMIIIDGFWEMKGFLKNLCRFNFQLYRTLKFGKRLGTDKYQVDLSRLIPHAKGIHMEEIVAYLTRSGLEDITTVVLQRVRDTQKKHAPWYLKYAYDYPTYMVTGKMPGGTVGHVE